MAKTYTLQQVADKLTKTRKTDDLTELLDLAETALSHYRDQETYNASDNRWWLKIAQATEKKYKTEVLSLETQETIRLIKNQDIGRQSVAASPKSGKALGLESLAALLSAKKAAESAKTPEDIADFTFSITDPDEQPAEELGSLTAAAEDSQVLSDQVSEAAEQNNSVRPDVVPLPRLNIKEISRAADADFAAASDKQTDERERQKRRKAGNIKMTAGCEAYIQNNQISRQNIGTLRSNELGFLYRNLQFSRLPAAQELLPLIEDTLFDRITDDLPNRMDNHEFIHPRETRALLKYISYYLNRINKIPEQDRSPIQALALAHFGKYANLLKIYQNPPKSKKNQTKEPVFITINQAAAAKKFSRLRIDEIEEAAAAHFRAAQEYPQDSSESQKERKQGNIQISIACAKYLKDNISSEEDWEQLTVRELVFLHKNLRKSRKDSRLSDILAAKCEARLKTAEARIDGGAGLESEEIEAFKDYCRYRLNDFKYQHNDNVLEQTAFYQVLLRKLDRAAQRPAAAREDTAQPAETEPPANTNAAPAENRLAQAFEKACEKREIRFNKTEDAATQSRQYELYPPRAETAVSPVGRLTIDSETDVSLQSEEFQHFVALAEAAKANGSPSLIIGELSPDPTEAKKFVAKLVLAGYVAKIEVQHSFDMAELAEIDPEIGKMQEIKRLKAEINKAKERKRQATEENGETAAQELREKSAAYRRYIIEHGDIYDARPPEERQQYFSERAKKRQHGPNNSVPPKDTGLSPEAVREIRSRTTSTR